MDERGAEMGQGRGEGGALEEASSLEGSLRSFEGSVMSDRFVAPSMRRGRGGEDGGAGVRTHIVGTTPAGYAAAAGHVSTTRLLLEAAGRSVHAPEDLVGSTAVALARRGGHQRQADELRDAEHATVRRAEREWKEMERILAREEAAVRLAAQAAKRRELEARKQATRLQQIEADRAFLRDAEKQRQALAKEAKKADDERKRRAVQRAK